MGVKEEETIFGSLGRKKNFRFRALKLGLFLREQEKDERRRSVDFKLWWWWLGLVGKRRRRTTKNVIAKLMMKLEEEVCYDVGWKDWKGGRKAGG